MKTAEQEILDFELSAYAELFRIVKMANYNELRMGVNTARKIRKFVVETMKHAESQVE